MPHRQPAKRSVVPLRYSSKLVGMSVSPDMTSCIFAAFPANWNEFLGWFSYEKVAPFFNSAFTTSLVGALAGAFAGAIAAQRIAERNKLREELTKEIRNTNAAITLAFDCVNTVLALKRQHVKELKEKYATEVERHKQYVAKRSSGQIQGNAPYAIALDFRSLSQTLLPLEPLQEMVFSRISVIGRPLNLVTALVRSEKSLNEVVSQRTEMNEMFKKGVLPPGATLVDLYLGLQYSGGNVSEEYGDLIGAISMHTDNAIFFSRLLCLDLHEHGSKVSERYAREFKKPTLRVTTIDFKQAEAAGLFPEDKDFEPWLKGFQVLPTPERKVWWKLIF